MEAIILILIAIVIIILALAPTLLIWSLISYFLPEWYNLSPWKMTFISFIASIIMVIALNLELESGIASIAPLVFIASIFLTVLLAPISIILKYRTYLNHKVT